MAHKPDLAHRAPPAQVLPLGLIKAKRGMVRTHGMGPVCRPDQTHGPPPLPPPPAYLIQGLLQSVWDLHCMRHSPTGVAAALHIVSAPARWCHMPESILQCMPHTTSFQLA